MTENQYSQNLGKTQANYQPLTPLTFLQRTARVFPDMTAIIHGKARISYEQFYARSRALAASLASHDVGKSDTVSALLANTPPMLEAHYGVPMCGAVLNTLNTRLDAAVIAFQLDHANAKVLIVDREFADLARAALAIANVNPLLIDYLDEEYALDETPAAISQLSYENLIAQGDSAYNWQPPADEWDAISLNYTSGTTGNPKGVVYHSRGAYLMGYANAIDANLGQHPVYLWTLPMFHCNGWCFPWSLSVVAGTHVCLRWVRAKAMYDAIATHKVTHLCGAPIVMSTLLNAANEDKRQFDHGVNFMTAAAPPPASVMEAMTKAGFSVTHLYGLTESYGPAVVNAWKESWDQLPPEEIKAKRSRQGVPYTALGDLSVIDPDAMAPVPADGATMGEVMLRGNIVMKGYLKNKDATDAAFAGGWFHTGDLGVMHADGYIQLKDRSKDIIISGGENISSIEVEDALYKHPDILTCAVVARPDDKWGESPCAFIELKPGAKVSADEIIAFARDNLARFKVPRTVIFTELPKTSTGKIQKFKLRQMARAVQC